MEKRRFWKKKKRTAQDIVLTLCLFALLIYQIYVIGYAWVCIGMVWGIGALCLPGVSMLVISVVLLHQGIWIPVVLAGGIATVLVVVFFS